MSSLCEWNEEPCKQPKASRGKKTYSLCWGHLDLVKQRRRELWAKRAEESKARREEASHILESAEIAGENATDPLLDGLAVSVVVRPANTSFAAQAKKQDGWQPVQGGIEKPLGVGAANLAYAQHYAESLREFGIQATAHAVQKGDQ